MSLPRHYGHLWYLGVSVIYLLDHPIDGLLLLGAFMGLRT